MKIACWFAAAWFVAAAAAAGPYDDLLDLHGVPADADDHSLTLLFDQGAWHGYGLPAKGDPRSGFTGPFLHNVGSGVWAGGRVGEIELTESGRRIILTLQSEAAAPGYLRRTFSAPGLRISEILYFPDSWRAAVRFDLVSDRPRQLRLATLGSVLPEGRSLASAPDGSVHLGIAGNTAELVSIWEGESEASVSGNTYRLALAAPITLKPGKAETVSFAQTLLFDPSADRPPPFSAETAWRQNRERWRGYLAAAANAHLPGLPDRTARRVAVKAIETLLGNWRAARGDLHHDGVVPSYSNKDYNGFWAWDSWKHAAALAAFAPDLAKSQIRAMFDYQDADGMIPDCLFLGRDDNNLRDSKPPLAAWATVAVYRATGDREFLAEMQDKLVRYHRWWATARDHDRDGLAQYGATDGTKIAAAWESGMDNAVRFDDVAMVNNGGDAWSADRSSVDLNAYLYAEKRDLAAIARILGRDPEAQSFDAEADRLGQAIQTGFFDAGRGYFFDRRLGAGGLITIYGPEGWIPLWAGAASANQARAVAAVMRDPGKFATFLPYPTLAADDPHFAPSNGYWRGPVWLDQAYFAIRGLERYGYRREAAAMALRIVSRAEGMTGQGPFRELYDPRNGRGLQSINFSWSAAHVLLLLGVGSFNAD